MTDWRQIVNTYGAEVFRLARRMTGRDQDAEDVVQDVFTEVYEYQQREPVRDWRALLRRKTAQRSLDRIRRRRPTSTLEAAEIVDHGASPVQAAVANELASRLRAAVANLPDQQAAVFCLRYFDGCSNAEIAHSLGIAAGAVATALHKARGKLATEFSYPEDGETT